ncbi:hypothetical protein MD484_g7754, partial [Candolleomyces efflorescens]
MNAHSTIHNFIKLDLSDIDSRYVDLDDLEARGKFQEWIKGKWQKMKEVAPKILNSPTFKAIGSAALSAAGNIAAQKLFGQSGRVQAGPAPAAPAPTTPGQTAPTPKAPRPRVSAKKAPARKAPVQKAPARKAPARKNPKQQAPGPKKSKRSIEVIDYRDLVSEELERRVLVDNNPVLQNARITAREVLSVGVSNSLTLKPEGELCS